MLALVGREQAWVTGTSADDEDATVAAAAAAPVAAVAVVVAPAVQMVEGRVAVVDEVVMSCVVGPVEDG